MTQEERKLLLKDLCARLPYGVIGNYTNDSRYTAVLRDIRFSCFYKLLVKPREYPLTNDEVTLGIEEFKPYLRPMSSMTEEEMQEYVIVFDSRQPYLPTEAMDWLNAHHFDYRGLIEKGLALEAPEGMYK